MCQPVNYPDLPNLQMIGVKYGFLIFFLHFLYSTDECSPLPTEMSNLAEYNAELRRPENGDDSEE